jgi:hypothetical protein
MFTTNGACITKIQLWYKGSMIATHSANPPLPTWLPPPDANGVRHIPEHASRAPKFTPISPFHIADYKRLPGHGNGKIPKDTPRASGPSRKAQTTIATDLDI